MTRPHNRYYKTRIAPTPSGFLHLGNVLSFAITAYMARECGAKTLLRIDDLDRLRINREFEQDIFDTLNFLEIPWDEGPQNVEEFEAAYSQIHRIGIYNEAIEQLKSSELLYACNCSRKQISTNGTDSDGYTCTCNMLHISLSTENVNWRLVAKPDAEISLKGYNGNTMQTTLPADMHNIIIKKKDGYPSYQLASVVDDLFYGVDLIVRGEDLWPSTIAQHQLADVLGQNSFSEIAFHHHPLLMETTDKKLSKSAGATSVKYLRQNGKSAADIYTLIAGMLGLNKRVSNWQELGEIAMAAIK